MKRWTVYCHTHIESGRRYIGITVKTMMHRWNQHCAQAKSAKGGRWHFPNAIRKYGKDAFSHEVLEVCHDLEVANLAEECWIELFDTRNPEKGFNLAKGGQHVPHPIRKNPWDDPAYRAVAEINLQKLIVTGNTPEVRAKMRASKNTPEALAAQSARSQQLMSDPAMRAASGEHANKGKGLSEEHRAKIGEANRSRDRELVEQIAAKLRGRKHTDEERAKISAANRRRRHSEETKRKIADGLARSRSQTASVEEIPPLL